MLNFMFPMPEEVIYQMSLDEDLDDGDYSDHGGGSYDPRYKPAPRSNGALSCPNCKCAGLKQIQTPYGPDLVYAFGNLAGKLHACP